MIEYTKYRIEYNKSAVKYINGLDKPTKDRMKIAIENLPKGDVKKLVNSDGEYRLRVGDYRVLFSINNDIITIMAIGPRGQVYKDRR